MFNEFLPICLLPFVPALDDTGNLPNFPGQTPAFIKAFSNLSHDPIRGLHYHQSQAARYRHTRLMVEYTPEFSDYEPEEVFLTVNECPQDNWFGAPIDQDVCIYRKKFTRREIEQTVKLFKCESQKPWLGLKL